MKRTNGLKILVSAVQLRPGTPAKPKFSERTGGFGSPNLPTLPQATKPVCTETVQASASASETRELPLTRGLFALIDAEDFERCSVYRWSAKAKKCRPNEFYVQRSVRTEPGRAGKKGSASLHRFVMGCEPGDGKIVDHVSGDPLDNRKKNLRITDARGNATNVTSSKNQKRGGFKGVTWNPRAGKWQASICAGEIKPNGKRRQLYLGCFTDPVDAAKAYDAAARKHFGEFAALNFPDGWFGPNPPPAVAADFSFLQAEVG